MTLATITAIEHVGFNDWRFTLSGTPPFSVYWRGELIAETDTNQVVVNADDNSEPPVIEAIYGTTGVIEPPALNVPPHLLLEWEPSAQADFYAIQQYSDGAWSTLAIVVERGESVRRSFRTGAQADGSAQEWRVVAVDENGYESEAVTYTTTMVTRPDPPECTLSVSGGTLTVGAP
jgi:hypothetical protein